MPPKRRSSVNPTSRSKSRSRSRSATGTARKRSGSKGAKARSPSVKKTSRKASPVRAASRSQEREDVVLEQAMVVRKFTPEKDPWDGRYEFMGWPGALAIMTFSHVLIYYFFVCIELFQGTIIYPGHPLLKGEQMHTVFLGYLREHACLTWYTFGVFSAFLIVQYMLALILPGPLVSGLPIPSENGYRYVYRCNAVLSWYFMIVLVGVLHYTEVFPLWELRDNYGHFLTAATVWADLIAVVVYVSGLPRKIRMTGNLIYDFFMGSALNYRLPGGVDVKLFAECRNSWVLLMMLTASMAAKMYKEQGYLTGNMWFMLVAHVLYVNAIQKGEECIISTWDLYYEKFGWMLAYWNTCGVPFLYCMQSLYIQTVLKDKSHPTWVLIIMGVVLLIAYYIWDTINSQKNRFRMKRAGSPDSVIRRNTFPQLPWRYIENPRTLKSSRGELFVDGFYRYARKLHYTVDVVMAFLWGSACGFDSFIPFFYVCFFISHLIDRERRDDHRCKRKYGKLWDEYVALVPYKYIPGIY